MTLSAKHLDEVCLLNFDDVSKTCRYLKNDELDNRKWYCQKLQIVAKKKIDKFFENKNIRSDVPQGNNCEGYPLLKHVIQGYDIIS
jgi:hypothetical protein